MLHGFLDEASHSHVAGWAADKSDANRIVLVSVFIDGKKIVQIECDQYRADLQALGLGNGLHGFRYDFPEKLVESSNSKIVVSFADTGDALSQGSVTLSKGWRSPLLGLDEERESQLMRLPAPVNQRALFELFILLEQQHGIHQLLQRLEVQGWTAQDAHYAVFGASENLRTDSYIASSCVGDYLNKLLFSDEFQRSVISSLLSAYAEKRRLIFIHIPKCAGTDLTAHMQIRYPTIDSLLAKPERIDKEHLFKSLCEFVKLTKFSDSIYLRGHLRLNYYLENQLARSQDRVFSILRDPIEIAVSRVNYVIMRMRQDFDRQRVECDTQEWLEWLGIEAMPDELSDEFVAQVCRQAFHCPRIVFPNLICHWLGGGDAKAVLERLAQHGVELTDTARYHRWLVESWGVRNFTRQNVSSKVITVAGLNTDEQDYLRECYCEDLKVYAALQRGLNASGGSSINGSELLDK
jgi:hypothetical protein